MQFEAGTLDASSWASDVATLERLVASPPYRAVWRMAREEMSGDYRDYVDWLMDKIPSDTSRSIADAFRVCTSATRGLAEQDVQPLYKSVIHCFVGEPLLFHTGVAPEAREKTR